MRMIAHSYDTYDHAERVVHALEAAGVPHDDISLVSGDQNRSGAASGTAGDSATATGTGTGATIGTVLGGGAGLLAGLGSLAIPGVGPIVAAGWLIATLTGAGVGAAAGGLLGSLTGAGVDETEAQGYAEHVGRGGTLVTVRASEEDAAQVEYILEHGEAQAATATVAPAMATSAVTAPAAPVGLATPVATPAAATAGTTATVGAAATGTGDTIKVMKEDFVVGKREVEDGAVRVTSRVVETPVEEKVALQEERVSVVRRPVNRPLTGTAADAFRERTVSATARSEEAVVGKEARVVEEIGIRKEVSDRTETVRDTVRETKVDVEQVPGSTTAARTAGTTQATGTTGTTGTTGQPSALRDNAATRAVDSTLGTNISGENPDRKV